MSTQKSSILSLSHWATALSWLCIGTHLIHTVNAHSRLIPKRPSCTTPIYTAQPMLDNESPLGEHKEPVRSISSYHPLRPSSLFSIRGGGTGEKEEEEEGGGTEKAAPVPSNNDPVDTTARTSAAISTEKGDDPTTRDTDPPVLPNGTTNDTQTPIVSDTPIHTNRHTPSSHPPSSTTTSTSTTAQPQRRAIRSLRDNASRLRTRGKELHDGGDFVDAARTFSEAATELETAIDAYYVLLDAAADESVSDGVVVGAGAGGDGDGGGGKRSVEEKVGIGGGEVTGNDDDGGGRNPKDHEEEEEEDEDEDVHSHDTQLLSQLTEECATCLLHQALCHLKEKKYVECIQSCTDVLKDGVQIIPLPAVTQPQQEGVEVEEQEEAGNDTVSEDNTDHEESPTTPQNKHQHQHPDGQSSSTPTTLHITPHLGSTSTTFSTTTSSSSTTTTTATNTSTIQLSAAVRARAFHRRAKARLALGDSIGALDDSRSAAFLGDRNAVALYGRLMREQGGGGGGVGNGGSGGGGGGNGLLGEMGGSRDGSSSVLESLFAGDGASSFGNAKGSGETTDILGKRSSSSSSSPFDILNSFMGSSEGATSGGDPVGPMFNPFDIGSLLGMGSGAGDGGGGGFDKIAKSVLLSLTSRIEDESTQKTISSYLCALDVTQLMSLSSMAGVPLNQSSADKIVRFANGFTPSRIRKYVRRTKRMLSVGNILRKALKVVSKYKHLLILLVLVYWIKMAIAEPVVVPRGAVKKAAKKAAKKAIQDAVSTASLFL